VQNSHRPVITDKIGIGRFARKTGEECASNSSAGVEAIKEMAPSVGVKLLRAKEPGYFMT
jgi:hypothetical protein